MEKIRKLWYKEYLYFRSNHVFYLLVFAILASGLHNFNSYYQLSSTDSLTKFHIFHNYRYENHNFIKFTIFIPEDIAKRENLKNYMIPLVKQRFPDLKIIFNEEKARQLLEKRNTKILVMFSEMNKSNNSVKYNIMSHTGELNKAYCSDCDRRRNYQWKLALEAQTIVNSFIEIFLTRGEKNGEKEEISINSFLEHRKNDDSYIKKQTNFFFTWILLLPLSFRLIDSWNDDRKTGFHNFLSSMKIGRISYLFAKASFWYTVYLVFAAIFWVPNMIMNRQEVSPEYIEFVLIYIACLVVFPILMISLFTSSPFFAKLVGCLALGAGDFGFGNIYHSSMFFQLSTAFFEQTGSDMSSTAILFACVISNLFLMLLLILYFDTFHSGSGNQLNWYFPLLRSYWMPHSRPGKVDQFWKEQILGSPKIHIEVPGTSQYSAMSEHFDPKPITPYLITLSGICKRIQNIWKVNCVNLTIRFGEITTLYGHIGCGSMEILQMISGALHPEFGTVTQQSIDREMVIAFDTDVPCLSYFDVRQYLEYVCWLRGTVLLENEREEIMEELDLMKVGDRTLDLLSFTQMERLRVGAAFAGHSDVVLLNMPIQESLPEWRSMIMRFIEKRKDNRAIVIASYDADETECISDQVVLISEGYVVLNGPIETFRQSINSVFEIRVWPTLAFTDEQVEGIMDVITCHEKRMKNDVKQMETPNGKLRVIIPRSYRKRIPAIYKELEQKAEKLDVSYFELSRPTVHDIYTNACSDPLQNAALEKYGELNNFYRKQVVMSPTWQFVKILCKTHLDRSFLLQCLSAFLIFASLVVLTIFTAADRSQHVRQDISFENQDHPVHIFCEKDCFEKDEKIRFTNKTNGYDWVSSNGKPQSANFINNKELDSVKTSSHGDFSFKMAVQNKALAQRVFMKNGNEKYPKIVPTLENDKIKIELKEHGGSCIFADFTTNQAFMMITDSYTFLQITALFQVFIHVLSSLLPLRLMALNLNSKSMLFPWSPLFYLFSVFICNILLFLVCSSIGNAALFLYFGLPFNQQSIIFLGAFTISYISTLPLIHLFVYKVKKASAILPSIVITSSLLVFTPLLIASYSGENSISPETLLNFLNVACFLSPPTTVQVLAAFFNAGNLHGQQNFASLRNAFIITCAQLWVPLMFLCSMILTKPQMIHRSFHNAKFFLSSVFDRRSTLKVGRDMKKKFRIDEHVEEMGEKTIVDSAVSSEVQPSTTSRSRARGAGDSKISKTEKVDKGVLEEQPIYEDRSHITKFEEDAICNDSSAKNWRGFQSVEVSSNCVFLIGDQTRIKSALLKDIVEANDKNRITYVPSVDCLPETFSPIQLFKVVAACHGIAADPRQIRFLLDVFGLSSWSKTKLALLTDSERRILAFLSKLMFKPSMIVLDQMDIHLPHSKMMIVWALCSQLRNDGIPILFTSRNAKNAEHTATCLAHVHKNQFVAIIPSQYAKAKMGCILLELDMKEGVDVQKIIKLIQLGLKHSVQIPTMSRWRVDLLLPTEDREVVELTLGLLRMHKKNINRFSLRSSNFEEYIASAFAK